MNTRLDHVDFWEGKNELICLHPNPKIGRVKQTLASNLTDEELLD
jgi:hypothetical protein